MNTFKIVILSIVQGITEVLPISSSGHLILTGDILNFQVSGDFFFLSVLHLGTTLAIIIFYRKVLFKNFLTKEKWIFFLKLAIASIPAALAGLLLEDFISSTFHGRVVIAVSLIIVGLLFIVFENIKRDRVKIEPEELDWKKMLLIGIGQTLALIPGTSRSGVTTLTGMMFGLDKYSAFKFSFILGIPVLLGGSLYEISKTYLSTTDPSLVTGSLSIITMLPLILLTGIIGYLSLAVVKKFKKEKWLTVFGIYRIIVGIILLVLSI